jgi:hypothetical protein
MSGNSSKNQVAAGAEKHAQKVYRITEVEPENNVDTVFGTKYNYIQFTFWREGASLWGILKDKWKTKSRRL